MPHSILSKEKKIIDKTNEENCFEERGKPREEKGDDSQRITNYISDMCSNGDYTQKQHQHTLDRIVCGNSCVKYAEKWKKKTKINEIPNRMRKKQRKNGKI